MSGADGKVGQRPTAVLLSYANLHACMEKFLRVAGRRTPPPGGALPSAEARAAMTRMAGYLTRAPKGIFRYKSHEEANRDREKWQVAAMVDKQARG